MTAHNIIPIGYFTASGNICLQDGVYIASNDNRRLICWSGRLMPTNNGLEVGLTLESYLSY